jgi:3-oxoacyl-[acyl-carrier protein] reductase
LNATLRDTQMANQFCVLITGSARGLGRAIALHLARPRSVLILHYRTGRDDAEQVATAVSNKGARAVLLQADLSSADQRESLMSSVEREVDHLSLMVNNAGIYLEKTLEETTPQDWQLVLDSTCSAVFHITQRGRHLLRAGAPSRVINIGDSGADRIVARTTATPYHVAKLGVHVLTRSFARLLTPDGVTVNQISPGFLENSVGAPGSPIPAGRLGEYTDVLAALDFLVSPEAQYVTGANIVVSGGWNL